MVRPECLNPKEVLSHLNSLGYRDISPQQLKEFIHDLKKLIKYEQKQNSQDCVDFAESVDSHSLASECSCSNCDGSCFTISSNESCDENSSVSDCSTSATFNRHGKLKRNRVDFEPAEKAQSSFIRPWNLVGSKEHSSRGKKNLDPVRLYHQYKNFWNRQNIPGEKKHSQLRWGIRNRMMGQEPQPRVFI